MPLRAITYGQNQNQMPEIFSDDEIPPDLTQPPTIRKEGEEVTPEGDKVSRALFPATEKGHNSWFGIPVDQNQQLQFIHWFSVGDRVQY